MKTQLIQFKQFGGPEVLELSEVELAPPAENEVQVKHAAVGVNFIDSYFRSGLYQTSLPSGVGTEAAGVVVAVGKNVHRFKEGDRVGYVRGPLGAYSQLRNIPANFLVKVPDAVSLVEAAAVLLKGLTVSYLFNQLFPLKKGDIFLFHAAAGGVGLIACQWAKIKQAELIGTVSSSEKAELIKKYGASEAINYTQENVVERVKELTRGEKLPVVFDSVGKDTWQTSLDCLRLRGLMVSFGNASGPVTGIDLLTVGQRGSLFVTRPFLHDYFETQEKLQQGADELFSLVVDKKIKVEIAEEIKLRDASLAHKKLTDRSRIGGMVLIPD